MKQVMLAPLVVVAVLLGGTASAQDTFIQIETHPDFNTARKRAQIFSEYLSDVKGFRIGSRWYGITLGPYDRETARSRLEALKELGMIPADSYLAERDEYSRQYYPVNINGLSTPEFTSDDGNPDDGQAGAEAETEAGTFEPQPPPPPTETRRQALRSEIHLPAERKLDLQRSLRDFGFYQGDLDAVFGKGTRRAMADWQSSKGHESTGVLTSRQREEILAEHEAVTASLGIRGYRDEIAGIEIELPGKMVAFDRYEPPFARYGAINDSGVTILLISQSGDALTLQALYEVMQTLEVVPPDARRERASSRFTLSGTGEHGRTFAYATLAGDAVKGFIVVWPEREDALHGIVLATMRESFTPIPGTVLPDALESGLREMSIDLIDGLDLRRPHASRSGFYIDGDARALTTLEAVNECDRITFDGIHDVELVTGDEGTGLALLAPTEPLVPIDYARIPANVPQPGSDVVVSGYSFGGALNAPTLTFGQLADLRGLNGERTVMRLSLAANPGDAGGPVLDATGSLLGLLMPADTASGKRLPPEVGFAVNTATISEFLETTGHALETSDRGTKVSAVAMAKLATDMTVLISCWIK